MWLFSPDLSLTPISQADQPMTLKNNTTTRGGGGGSSRRRESYALKRRTNLTTHLADLRTRKCEHCISKAIVTTVTQDHVATGCADTAVVQVAYCECTFKKWDLTLKKSWQLFFFFLLLLISETGKGTSINLQTHICNRCAASYRKMSLSFKSGCPAVCLHFVCVRQERKLL